MTNPSEIFRIARQMRDENQDIVGENCVFNDAGDLCIKDKDKMLAWDLKSSQIEKEEEKPWIQSHRQAGSVAFWIIYGVRTNDRLLYT